MKRINNCQQPLHGTRSLTTMGIGCSQMCLGVPGCVLARSHLGLVGRIDAHLGPRASTRGTCWGPCWGHAWVHACLDLQVRGYARDLPGNATTVPPSPRPAPIQKARGRHRAWREQICAQIPNRFLQGGPVAREDRLLVWVDLLLLARGFT